jgi:hypothetical protein
LPATVPRRQAVQRAALQEQVKVQQAALGHAASLQQASAQDQEEAQHQVAWLQQAAAAQQATALHHQLHHQQAALQRHASFVQPPEVPEQAPGTPRPDSPLRSAVQKLQSQLRHKDEKLRQLKDAIRCASAPTRTQASSSDALVQPPSRWRRPLPAPPLAHQQLAAESKLVDKPIVAFIDMCMWDRGP